MNDPRLEERADTIIQSLEEANDSLEELGHMAATAKAEAKKVYARAILRATDAGHGKNREERLAYADLEAADAEATAEICERIYRDRLTWIRTLQSQLELIRTTMVTHRQIQV